MSSLVYLHWKDSQDVDGSENELNHHKLATRTPECERAVHYTLIFNSVLDMVSKNSERFLEESTAC